MKEEFMDLYRYRIFEKCKIMVNDLTDVFKEIDLFIEKRVKLYLRDKGYSKLIFDGIELRVEDEQFVWSVHDKDELIDPNAKEITIEEVNKKFKAGKEFLKYIDEEEGIILFPKELYGKALMILAETTSEFIQREVLIEEMDIFGIFKIGNNGENNIIY